MQDHYTDFLASKRLIVPACGVDVPEDALNAALFPFQRDLVRWALRKGRSALFTDTGTGKTLMQLVWAEHAAERTLILAPLAVARQTVAEGQRFGIPVTYARSQDQAAPRGITITNYEMLSHFDPAAFGAVVLDESSILANFSGVTKKALVAAFRQTPMRLCCTATPAPNDIVELTNHADFLGVMKATDMVTTFFISKGKDQKDGKFRLKSHARKPFFRWLASWAMALKRPSDLGYSDDGYNLPPLDIRGELVGTDYVPPGYLFPVGLHGVQDRAAVRRGTLADRVERALSIVRAEPDEPWLIWCGLNDEANAITAGIPGAVNVEGADTPEHKAEVLTDFAEGRLRVLVTKPSIAGFGLNLQRCARMLFVGLSDSYQTYYQSIRRCWRYGQTRAVTAHIVLSELEQPIYENVLRKESEAAELHRELIANVAAFERIELGVVPDERDPYEPTARPTLPAWLSTYRTEDVA